MPAGKYLANAFSLSMLTSLPVRLLVEELTKEQFCTEIRDAISSIGHEATAQVLAAICGNPITVNRTAIQVRKGDVIYVFQLLTRLPEGRILNAQELQQMITENKVKFLRVTVE